MRTPRIFLFFFLFLCKFSPYLNSQSITWYQPNFPPYVIIEETKENRGIDNRIVESVIPELTEYEHYYEVANYTRILENLLKGECGIITPLFKTPQREKFVLYSARPSYFVLPNGFIYRKEDRNKYVPFLKEDGSLDLEALCRSGEFGIGINTGRSYSGILDRAINEYGGKKPFNTRSAMDQLGILNMVVQKRIDGAFGFPVEIKYIGLEEELGFFPVSQMVDLIPVYFGAPMTPEGAQIIETLNRILDDEKWRERFTDYYIYWLNEEWIPEYKQLIKQFK
jgi:uncharacterized protein (TIGR02285 family)